MDNLPFQQRLKMKNKISLIGIRKFILPIIIALTILRCSASEGGGTTDNSGLGGYNLAELNNYGDWIQISPYGNAWQPYVVNDWMPFENGHWVFADGNWTWISYEPFGWIVYHYGYWYDDPFYGWVWLPSDDAWSPARVSWIDYDDYIGWAPLPPPGINYGNPWERNEYHYWHVVRHRDFTEDNLHNYLIVNPTRNEIGNREVIKAEPKKNEIERYANKPIPEIKIQRENITLPPRQIKKMNLPMEENRRVEQNAPRVRNEVLLSKEVFHKQYSERSNPKK
jgi:hypothetical protein